MLIELIGAVYDSVIDPSRWHGTVSAIRRHVRMHNGVLAVNNLIRGDGYGTIFVRDGFSDHYLSVAYKYPEETLALWGGPQRIATLPLEEPVIQSQVTDPDGWTKNAYYREFIRPRGLSMRSASALPATIP
jgi:hypothetical protein